MSFVIEEGSIPDTDSVMYGIRGPNSLLHNLILLLFYYIEFNFEEHWYSLMKVFRLLPYFDRVVVPRRTRPDGNCFFRGFGFRLFEILREDEDKLEAFKKAVEGSKGRETCM